MAQDQCVSTLMPSSSHNAKPSHALALKQAANWQCRTCGRHCRRHDESLDDFAARIGNEVEAIAAHPRRWALHVTKLQKHTPTVQHKTASKQTGSDPVALLCGSCHRKYHNSHRWKNRQRQYHQHLEHIGQLTLNDIRLPLTGLQLSLSEWSDPYEIVNPLQPRKRTKTSKTSGSP
ncbi:hypothetical protein SPB21_02725 [Leptothoe sp. ISB3NOV94-8A]|nr:hypothetical protein [Adonisia turfae]MDV3348024.1 hypothetical protein [Leptothoe sp. LEGE 181152]